MSVQFNVVVLIDTYDCMLQLGRHLLRGGGFRQIDLNLRLVFFKRRRNDKENQKDDQNIDQRNDNDGGRSAFADDEVHNVGCTARFTPLASASAPIPAAEI